jgi:Tol biopolymer transport system component
LDPSGNYIIYVKLYPKASTLEGGTLRGIAILDLTTGKETQLTNSPDDFGPSWMPDGKHILFYSPAFVEKSAGGVVMIEHKKVPNTVFTAENSAAAKKDLYQAESAVETQLIPVKHEASGAYHVSFFVMNSDGTGRKQLTNVGESVDDRAPIPTSEFSWSSNETVAVYDSEDVVWTISFDKKFEKLSAKRIGNGRNPHWSESNNEIIADDPTKLEDKRIIKYSIVGQIIK